jgi:outer membrane receptor protein involved in Fe transport
MAVIPTSVRGSAATAGYARLASSFLFPAILIFSIAVPCQARDAASRVVVDDIDAVIDEIVVTGTRIKRKNMISTSPLTQVNADEFSYKGVTRVEDLLNDLPQVFPEHHANLSYESTGTATVDLRGLGSGRTLTLLNGRRLPSGSPYFESTDVNQIPGMLIERVEVLTGGASATYGSDAVGGVVNFITPQDFEGLQVDYQFSQYQHRNENAIARAALSDAGFDPPPTTVQDGNTHNFSVMYGIGDGSRGNFTAYASYRHIEALTRSERDHSACVLEKLPTGGWECQGSLTIPDGYFTDFGVLANAPPNWDPAVDGPWPGGFDVLVEPGSNHFVAADGHPGQWYNFAPLMHYQRPDERITFGAFGHYVFSDRVEVYLEANFMDDRSDAQIAESGSFFFTNTVNCNNPFLSAQQFELLCGRYNLSTSDTQTVFIGRRNVEGGPRIDHMRHEARRGVLGARGVINDHWSYDAFVNLGEVDLARTYGNDMSVTRITRALDAIADPVTGAPVCVAVIDGTDPDCVPWNVFESGAVTKEMTDYLELSASFPGDTRRLQVTGFVSGDLTEYGWVMPTAEDGVQVVFGVEYRDDELNSEPDAAVQSGDLAGFDHELKPVHGGYDLQEFFMEAVVPLVQDKKGAELISVDLGYRYSDYSTGVDADTYKIAGEWMLNSSIRLRGSLQRAVRAGTIHELFRPLTKDSSARTDTCVGAVPRSSFEQCQNTGVTADQYGTITDPFGDGWGWTNGIWGGNPNLEPEESDTVSFGFILTPEFLPALSLSVDYFEIEVDKAIEPANAIFIFNQCLETGLAEFCDDIHRDPATGTLWVGDAHIFLPDTNIAFLKTTGIDAIADYDLDIGRMGGLQLSLALTYLDTLMSQEHPGADVFECAGGFNWPCRRPSHKWAGNFRAIWATPWDASVVLSWRHTGKVDDLWDDAIARYDLGLDYYPNDIEAMDYFDLAATWNITDGITLRFGINNLLDEDPPFTVSCTSVCNGNTFPGTYDPLGRYLFTGISMKF